MYNLTPCPQQSQHRLERGRRIRGCFVARASLTAFVSVVLVVLTGCLLVADPVEGFSNAPTWQQHQQLSRSITTFLKRNRGRRTVSSRDDANHWEYFLPPTILHATTSPSSSSSSRGSNANDLPTEDAGQHNQQPKHKQQEEEEEEEEEGVSSSFSSKRAGFSSPWNDEDHEIYQINLRLKDLADECSRNRNVTAAQVALDTLRSMKQQQKEQQHRTVAAVDSVAYNSVLKALAKISPAVMPNGRTASDTALVLLQDMRLEYQKQVAANEAWYQQLSGDNSKNNGMTDEELERGAPRVRVKPSVRSVSTVMDALGRTGNLEAAQRAEELLEQLQRDFEETGDSALEPNLISYNTLLSAYANCGEPSRCLKIIREMPVEPDIISHNAVLHALARSSNSRAGELAEAYFRKQITNVRPNARSYSTCMDAWSKLGQPERAYKLLLEMAEAYRSSGRDPALRPNAITYSTVIHGYAVSRDPQKAIRAFQVFQQMQKEGVKPNQVTLNNVLNSCAKTTPPTPIVRRIIKTIYEHALQEGNPDEVTFGIVLKACENWMDESTISPIDVFEEACRRGVVSPGVLHHLRGAVQVDTFRKLVGSDSGNWSDLPLAWRKRAKRIAYTREPRLNRPVIQ